MNNANTNDSLTVNRTFKSTLFIMLFEDRKNLLELYNAITGKHYADPELLEINTLENAIYMSMKNDVSFLIDGRLSLYEHQSTKNPNLPLRFLLYISHLFPCGSCFIFRTCIQGSPLRRTYMEKGSCRSRRLNLSFSTMGKTRCRNVSC